MAKLQNLSPQAAADFLKENPSFFVVEHHFHANNHVEILIDTDAGITIAQCQQVNRLVVNWMEEHNIDGTSRVASPGVDYPLKSERQFAKNMGRKLAVTLTENAETLVGELTDVDDETIELQWKAREPKPVGKGKVTVSHNKKIKTSTIEKAQVLIS